MVDNLHTKRLRLLLQIPSNTSHSQHTEDFALWIMSQSGRRLATPFPFAEGLHARIEVAQGADDQEHVYVGGGVVDGGGDIGDADGGLAEGAGVNVDLVVSGAWY